MLWSTLVQVFGTTSLFDTNEQSQKSEGCPNQHPLRLWSFTSWSALLAAISLISWLQSRYMQARFLVVVRLLQTLVQIASNVDAIDHRLGVGDDLLAAL